MSPLPTATGLLKLFLREMEEPLLTYDLYDAFLRALDGERHLADAPARDRALTFRSLLAELPPHNLTLLQHLCTFLARVAERCSVNQMTFDNLVCTPAYLQSIVFGPAFLRQRSGGNGLQDSLSGMADTPKILSVTLYILENFSDMIASTNSKFLD